MPKYIDCHCHLLPGVDDGSQHLADSLRAFSRLDTQGFGHAILTPHVGEDGWWFSDPDKVREMWEMISAEVWPVQLHLWAETNCANLNAVLGHAQDGTLVTIGPNDTVLLEYETDEDLNTILLHAYRIKAMGYDPVLAHPERLNAFREEPGRGFGALRDLGIGAQINAYSLVLERRDDTKMAARKALDLEVVRLLGSDSHPPKRWPQMTEGVQYITSTCSKNYAKDVLWRNAQKMLGIYGQSSSSTKKKVSKAKPPYKKLQEILDIRITE